MEERMERQEEMEIDLLDMAGMLLDKIHFIILSLLIGALVLVAGDPPGLYRKRGSLRKKLPLLYAHVPFGGVLYGHDRRK